MFGCKNENACPERKMKRFHKSGGGKYVYFNEESKDIISNVKFKKFHACASKNHNYIN